VKLDSARDLKHQLTRTLLHPLTSGREALSLALAAQPRSDAAGHHRTIALGVARKGRSGFHLAVRVQRRELENGDEVERIRKRAKGEVDVRYVGRLVKRATPWHQKENRPLRVGGSVGHFRITAGTLGCFVTSRSDGSTFILSNNHVLADENRADVGDAVLQPGAVDGGKRPGATIGKLARFIALKKMAANVVDCALASVDSSISFNASNLDGLGAFEGMGAALLDPGTEVAKVGRTTGTTRGRVTAFELDNLIVGFDIGSLRFDDQIEIEGAGDEPFSDGGDSGSVIVDADRMAVGLLFAGGDVGGANDRGLTYANPMLSVIDALDVDLLH